MPSQDSIDDWMVQLTKQIRAPLLKLIKELMGEVVRLRADVKKLQQGFQQQNRRSSHVMRRPRDVFNISTAPTAVSPSDSDSSSDSLPDTEPQSKATARRLEHCKHGLIRAHCALCGPS